MKPLLLKRGVYAVLAGVLIFASWWLERWTVCYALDDGDKTLFCFALASRDPAQCAHIVSGPLRLECEDFVK